MHGDEFECGDGLTTNGDGTGDLTICNCTDGDGVPFRCIGAIDDWLVGTEFLWSTKICLFNCCTVSDLVIIDGLEKSNAPLSVICWDDDEVDNDEDNNEDDDDDNVVDEDDNNNDVDDLKVESCDIVVDWFKWTEIGGADGGRIDWCPIIWLIFGFESDDVVDGWWCKDDDFSIEGCVNDNGDGNGGATVFVGVVGFDKEKCLSRNSFIVVDKPSDDDDL